MQSVLFVDDEPNVLSGLKRSLRGMRDQWRLEFATSGAAALAFLQDHACDVIVSDIRMQEMDGVQLLSTVKERYPRMIRLALSGHAETENELECVSAAHQFLAKPASAEDVRLAVERTAKLKALLGDAVLESTIGSVDALPSLPELYQRILREAADPNGTIMQAGAIAGEDVGMSAKILQIANSAFFGLPRAVDSVQQAAAYLGFDVLKSLVLSHKVFSAFADAGRSGLDLNRLIQHGNRTGTLAKAIGVRAGLPAKDCDRAMMAGLLHNVGKLILATLYPDRYAAVSAAVKQAGQTHREAERAEFGVSHEAVGAYLLGVWGLPSPIGEAVAFHHAPAESGDRTLSVLSCVYLAGNLVRADEQGLDDRTLADQLDLAYLRAVMPDFDLREWRGLPGAGGD